MLPLLLVRPWLDAVPEPITCKQKTRDGSTQVCTGFLSLSRDLSIRAAIQNILAQTTDPALSHMPGVLQANKTEHPTCTDALEPGSAPTAAADDPEGATITAGRLPLRPPPVDVPALGPCA
jgi:hypothetical protein